MRDKMTAADVKVCLVANSSYAMKRNVGGLENLETAIKCCGLQMKSITAAV